MNNIHFLPAKHNNARLSANPATINASAMPEPSPAAPDNTAAPAPHVALIKPGGSKNKRYEQLVQLYHADIYRYSYWLCKDANIAQDLVQETFLRAWKHLDSLLDTAAAKSWLITILRRENARRFERKQFDYDDAAEQDSLPDTEQSSVEQDYDNHKLRIYMAALPEEYREPLVMQVIGGFSSDEIASLLQLNVNTVNTRLFRARKLLREQLNINRHGETHHE
ncbi:RNA polymerase sigma-70 factor (ECF subfamily) [Rheinheimera pacifica]|uniref:sigma-70 family RNA polymerase sigma factor n=1 Tax=Rheinheimera pacifica TaxID=173990 RepID=UPI002168BA8E|nr:sigma-70 family RNA polymerase sigma factor [Rheinheimera pacifica]MCS4308019.1 RNA polymerase sigma-70 factor (ECF subfamily) [Rheinheimera pacifica]